jgi:hypothetical protein
MPWGNFYVLGAHDTQEEAQSQYANIVEQLRSGKAKIEIGESFSIVAQTK